MGETGVPVIRPIPRFLSERTSRWRLAPGKRRWQGWWTNRAHGYLTHAAAAFSLLLLPACMAHWPGSWRGHTRGKHALGEQPPGLGEGHWPSEIRSAGRELSSFAGNPGLEFNPLALGLLKRALGLKRPCWQGWGTSSSPRSLRAP